MKVQILSFHCVLKDRLGRVISSSFNQDVINQAEAGKSGALPGLVPHMQNLRVGEKRQVRVSADQAYGLYDPKLIFEVPRSELRDGARLALGNEVLRKVENSNEPQRCRVIHANRKTVVLDGNHPLAGQDLIFDIEVVASREALPADFEEDRAPLPNHYLH